MTLLANAMRERFAKSKDYSQKNEMTYSVSYPTGFLNLDAANGYVQEVNGKLRYELGLCDGSINMIISDSGLGKTTLCTQIAANMCRQFKTTTIFYEQAERGTNIQRIKNISGFSDDSEFAGRFVIRDAGITIESVYERVRMIHDIKIENREKFLYDTGMKDYLNNPVYKFEPTIIIVDSVKMVLTKKNAEAEETTNMSGAGNAKANSEYYTRMVPICTEANIIMILINHINKNINMSFLPEKPEFPYLKQGEHIAGGRDLQYIQNNIFRIDQKSKLKSEEGFGINGSIVNIDVVKSRTNISSRARCLLVYNQETGYDSDLSLFIMLKENKIIEGSGAYLKLPGYDKKFSQRQFKEILYSDPEFYNVFVGVCLEFLRNVLYDQYLRIKAEAEARKNRVSPYQSILERLNDID